MKTIRQSLTLFLAGAFTVAAVISVVERNALSQPQSAAAGTALPPSQPAPAAIWKALQERTPFPYTLPLPPARIGAVDGLYVKQEPIAGDHVHCLRCPDWLYEGGLWKLRLNRGIFRIFHEETRWKSIGSCTASKDRLILFNDPACIEDIGVYRWNLDNGVLTLEVIDDPCAIRLRGKNLEHMPWRSCRPPNIEAAVTDHWPKPTGCE